MAYTRIKYKPATDRFRQAVYQHSAMLYDTPSPTQTKFGTLPPPSTLDETNRQDPSILLPGTPLSHNRKNPLDSHPFLSWRMASSDVVVVSSSSNHHPNVLRCPSYPSKALYNHNSRVSPAGVQQHRKKRYRDRKRKEEKIKYPASTIRGSFGYNSKGCCPVSPP